MKKLITLLTICLLAVNAWGDVSVTEKFSQIEQIAAVPSDSWTADICSWSTAYARHRKGEKYIDDKDVEQTNEDVITVSGNQMYSVWMSAAADNKRGCIQTTNLEGGIKAVSFRWAQFGSESGNRLALEVKAGTIVDDSTTNADLKRVSGGANKISGGISYTHTFNCQTNGQLCIKNISKKGGDNACRILIGHISITPYLYYMQKEVTIGLPNKGYINRNLIDNTGETANIRYSVHDKNAETKIVADIDENTGAITPKAVGTAVVTASWEGVTTTYELTVSATTYLEAFSKRSVNSALDKTAEQSWENCGDVISSWKAWEARRKVDADTILGTYVQGTQIRALANDNCANGYIKSAAPVEGGIKAATMKWRQYGQAFNTTLQLQTYFDGVATGDASAEHAGNNDNPRAGLWTYNPDFSEIATPNNPVFEIRNISTRTSGSNKPNVVISSITITPWLLYYTKECTLDMQVASADPTLTFKNEDLINNTIGTDPTYAITNYGGISNDKISVADDGTVSVADRFQTGDIEVQAKWSEVTTTYTLHVLGKTASNASFTNAKVYKDISDGSFTIACSKDAGTPSYTSSNTSIVTVNPSTGEVTLVGVGQDTITATITESETVGGSTAYYILYVTDNSENVQVEHFSNINDVTVADALANPVWEGDLFDWRVLYAVRRNNDKFPSDISSTTHFGTWMSIPDPVTNYATLQSEDVVEGGIKYLWFYWEQWGTETNRTLKLNVYTKSEDEEESLKSTMAYKIVGETVAADPENRMLFGVSDLMRSNSQLIIKNASHNNTGTRVADRCRVILDDIHITPYLLYTEKSATLDTRDGTKTYKNTSLIDNTEGGHISYESSDENVATVANDGTVTATGFNAGTIIITATWDDEGAGASTSYELTVIVPEVYSNTETFDNITKATANYSNSEISKAGVAASWSVILGGFNYGVTSGTPVDHNCARFRAPYDESSEKAYLQSSIILGGIKSLSFDYNVGGDESKTNWDIRVLIIQETDTVKKYILTDFVKAVQDQFITVNIPDINISGDFVIRFENHSTRTIEYTSENRGRFLIDNIRWEGLPMALEDDADNSTVIENNAGYKRNVMLADRTIRTGGYNTLCLPFAMSAEQLAESPLAGGKVYKFTNAYLGADNLDIRFEKVNAMEAGKPYLVTVPADVENPVFEGVTINNSTENNTATGANMRFIGSFNQGTMYETGLYVVANSLYRVSNITSGDKTIGACRAYFDVPTGSPALAPSVRMRIVTHTDHATGMEQINQAPQTNVQKVIRDGQLYIIYEGRMYDVRGMRVK